MSPEFNFYLKINAGDAEEATSLRQFLLRIEGVEEINALAQIRVETDAIDLAIPMGKVVRAWRMERGMKGNELARRAGRPITPGYLSQFERDIIHHPSNSHLSRLADALGISIMDIVTRRMPPKKDLPLEDNKVT